MANWDHASNIGTHPELLNGAHNGLAQVGGNVRTEPTPDVQGDHVPVGSLVTVTIGRNVTHEVEVAKHEYVEEQRPMRRHRWADFLQETAEVLEWTALSDANVPSQVFGPFLGHGEWDGVTEESATFTAITSAPQSVKLFNEMLADLAERFDQDAIAWSFGTARLARR